VRIPGGLAQLWTMPLPVQLVDIIGCLGNFSMLAMLLNTFQVDLKDGDPEPFPDVHGFTKVTAPEEN
jgi:hypothetical protein